MKSKEITYYDLYHNLITDIYGECMLVARICKTPDGWANYYTY